MRTNFGDLVIEQAIVHVVPQRRRSDPTEEIPLSEAVCNLNDAVRTALQAKLRGVLAATGREIEEDPESKSSLPEYVHAFLTGDSDLVEVSADMVHLLRNSQTGVSPAGLLLVADAKLAGKRALLLVKLEQETGMQAKETYSNGLRTFDMQYFADLLFTEKSKVYKIALFSEEGISEEGIEGWAADRQMTGKMARFFLERFLGCRQKNEPREVTRRFHDATTEWINKYVTDPDVRINYIMATLAELQSPVSVLDPTAFAQQHLDITHRDDFTAYLDTADVPARAFDKDIEALEPRLKNMRVAFANGVFIVAPIDAMHDDEIVQLEDQGDGRTSVIITGTVTTAAAYAPPGGRKRVVDKVAEDPSPQKGDDDSLHA
ncbi:nucleoid-associated protein [Streptomyces sp. NBC_01285]|uniref:nucleoid-associated protein n=1 Tax=Streptomyces sp. NBC_01285 TaxID=2903813 RepID=UPI0022561563|nr:nucleoid-associated protein [Streptomyces sp. NBC_01285]MCX4771185.1 nucleoid-associated protein [Streptomyces sp. NBC_01285]